MSDVFCMGARGGREATHAAVTSITSGARLDNTIDVLGRIQEGRRAIVHRDSMTRATLA